MNPIHEAVFAGMMLTVVVAAVPWGLTFVTIVLSLLRKPRATAAASTLVSALVAGLLLLEVLSTTTLHERVDQAVKSGGYGPPELVRQQYAKEIVAWHASANDPAEAALILCVPALVVVFFMLRRVEQLKGPPRVALVIAAVAAVVTVLVVPLA